MRRLLVILFLVLFLVVAVVVYAPYTSVNYSDSDSGTIKASWPLDLPDTVHLYLSAGVGNARELVPGGYTCYAGSGLDVRVGGGSPRYSVRLVRSGVVRAGFYGLFQVKAPIDTGHHSKSGSYTTTEVETGFAGTFKSPAVDVTVSSCTSFPCSLTATLWDRAGCSQGSSSGGGGGGSPPPPPPKAYVGFYVVGGDANRFYPFRLSEEYVAWLPRWGVNGSEYSVVAGRKYVLGVNSSRFYALLREPVLVNRLGRGLTLYTSGTLHGTLGYGVAWSDKLGGVAVRFKLAIVGRGSGDLYLRFPEGTKVALSHVDSYWGLSTASLERVNDTTWRLHVRVRGYYSWQAGWVSVWIDYRKAYFYDVRRVELYQYGRGLVASTTNSSLEAGLGAHGYRVYIYVDASSPGARGFYVVPGGLVYVSNLTGVTEPVVRPLTGPAGDVEFTVYMGGDFESGRFRPDRGALKGYRESTSLRAVE